MTSTHRAENIFSKYLLYYVHEIARKYPREKNRYSGFSDSVCVKIHQKTKTIWILECHKRCGESKQQTEKNYEKSVKEAQAERG
jgi:hypothetical protein